MTALIELPSNDVRPPVRPSWSEGGWAYTATEGELATTVLSGTTGGAAAVAGIPVGGVPVGGIPDRGVWGPVRIGRAAEPALRRRPAPEPERTFFVSATEARDLEALPDITIRNITNLRRANDAADLNALFRVANAKLPVGGSYTGCAETCAQARRRYFTGRPGWRAWPLYALYFLFRRVLPKLALTRRAYYALARGRGHALSKTEVLGRLVYCGFEVAECWEADDELHFVAEKRRPPSEAPPSPTGLLFRMERVGQGGRLRWYYKLRTMHPYAEHLQATVHATNALAPNGKFHDDFRITSWGRFMRKTWLDELPMVVNLLRGDLKLVGVRPLSRHYLSLYPADLLAIRLRHKPGLIPPFYADLPEGFDAICDSERRYLEAYERSPLRTDLRYFACAFRRIVLERARSQ